MVVPTVPVYCDVEDIADFIGFDIDDTTRPNIRAVQKLINYREDDIDNRTARAWRVKTVTEEYHHLERGNYIYGFGWPLKLLHRKIKQPDVPSGDKLEMWTGSSNPADQWENWFSTRSEGQAYNLNLEQGIIWVRGFLYTPIRRFRFRVTYRYGETTVPLDIRLACIWLVAADLVENADYWNILPQGTDRKTIEAKVRDWEEKASEKIARHAEIIMVGH